MGQRGYMGWLVLGWWENDVVYCVRGWKDLMGWGGLGVVEWEGP